MQSMHDFMLHRRSVLAGLAAGGVAACVGSRAWAQTSAQSALAAPIRVAAASDLKFALTELGSRFERDTGFKLNLTFSSSGNLARQLEQGLPMDLFLSADEALVMRLAKNGWARDEGVVYALGRLAWLVPKSAAAPISGDLKGLMGALGISGVSGASGASRNSREGGKLAIANPDHAPYGRAARAALQSAGLWPALQGRLVLGENVSQATQFVSTGAASAGLIALSLALAPEVVASTRHGVVDAALHPPIIQRMALSRAASASAQQFYAFLQTDGAKKVLSSHGLG